MKNLDGGNLAEEIKLVWQEQEHLRTEVSNNQSSLTPSSDENNKKMTKLPTEGNEVVNPDVGLSQDQDNDQSPGDMLL